MDLKSMILSAHPAEGQAAVFYLGQETILLKCDGRYILFDPYLTDYVDRHFCTETVIWRRNYSAPIEAGELDMIDYVFCSHAHGDHADPETLAAVAAASPQAVFVGGETILEVYRGCGIPASRMLEAKADVPLELGEGLIATPIPSAHEELHPDGAGSYTELGFVVDFHGLRFYHAGDCCVYDGLRERIDGVDVAFMPINGQDYYRLSQDIIGNFDSIEAIRLADAAHVGMLVPMHFDLYDVNCVNPAYFVDCLTRIAPKQRFHIFMPGEKLLVEP